MAVVTEDMQMADVTEEDLGIVWEWGRWSIAVTPKGSMQKKKKKPLIQILNEVLIIECCITESKIF